MPYATPHDGSGTVLRFGATTYTVTNVVIANTNPAAGDSTIDVANLGQTTGEQAATISTPLVPAANGDSGRQITFDYLGKTILLDGATGTVVITVAGTALLGATTGVGATSFVATVASSTLTLATNDAIRGQGVLTLARTSSIT
jgi:hypothetical protein